MSYKYASFVCSVDYGRGCDRWLYRNIQGQEELTGHTFLLGLGAVNIAIMDLQIRFKPLIVNKRILFGIFVFNKPNDRVILQFVNK